MLTAILTLIEGAGTFLVRYWRFALPAILAVLLGLQSARLHHAKHDLAAARAALVDPVTHRRWSQEAQEAQRDLGTCRASVTDLRGSLDAQNRRVDALKADGDARAQAATDAAQAARSARAVAESYRRRAEGAQATGDHACPAVDQIIDEVLK